LLEGLPTRSLAASILKCPSAIRYDHLLKTFWGWRDQQLRDGTVIWTSPSGDTYTTPGSALLFPSLCAPTGELTVPAAVVDERCGERTAMMPTRRRTRAQDRAHRIAAERRQNQRAREARRPAAFLMELLLLTKLVLRCRFRAHNGGVRPKFGEPR
jgi:hypothetical protein